MNKTTDFNKINDFLELYKHKQHSLNKHKKAIELFLITFPDINPEEYFKDIRLLTNRKQIQIKDKIETDLIKFQQTLENNYSANTIKSYISSIRTFLEHCHINLEPTFWKKLNLLKKTTGNSHSDMTPNKEELKLILSNAKALDKALFLTIVTTGLRESEILNINITDLHLNENPPRIDIKTTNNTTKKRVPYAYITDECKLHIELWLKQREQHIERTKKISHLPIKWEISNKLFPISKVTARNHWNNLLNTANLNERSENLKGRKQYRFHFYTLRKHFRSYLGNRDLAEYLMGHRNLSNQYFNKNEEDIKKDYLEYSKNLYVFSNPPLPKDMQQKIQEDEKKFKGLKDTQEQQYKDYKGLLKEVEILKELLHKKIHQFPNTPYDQLNTYSHAYNNNNNRVDYDINPKTRKLERVQKSRQNQINEHFKEQIEYELILEHIRKQHPEYTEQQIETIAWEQYQKNKKTTLTKQ